MEAVDCTNAHAHTAVMKVAHAAAPIRVIPTARVFIVVILAVRCVVA